MLPLLVRSVRYSSSMRTLLALAAGESLSLEHFDVTSAFTQSDIDCDIYVEPPKGYPMKTTDGRDAVLKLKRALYGTKQASRLWQQRLAGHLENKMGFYRSTTDPCLFSRRHSDGSVILLGVYVDDIIVAHNRKNFEWFTKEFTAGFNSKHLGKLTWFLGMGVDQNDDYSVTVNQTSYVKKLIEKFIPNHATSAINHNMRTHRHRSRQRSSDQDMRKSRRDRSEQALPRLDSLFPRHEC